MNFKKIKMIDVFIIFILCFLFHNLYKWFPNVLFSIFFPVNESIWEHMKIIFDGIIISYIFDYEMCKRYKIKVNNLLCSSVISSILSIVLFLIIYLPLYLKFGENMFVTLLLLFITICVSQIISYYITIKKELNYNMVWICIIIISYISFGFLTYYPPKNFLFYDTIEDKYGINIYTI